MTIVAVEVFMEEDVVAPVGISLEFLRAAVDWSPAMLVAPSPPREVGGVPLVSTEQVKALVDRIEHVFIRDRKLELFEVQRSLEPWRNPVRSSEDAANHRCNA